MTDPSEPAGPAPDDDRLVAELGGALDPDPLPPGLVARASALVEVLDLEHDLALLLEPEPGELAGTRGAPAATAMTFELADGTVSIDVQADRDGVSGQLLAGTAAEVVLERLSGERRASAVDELGHFAFDRVPPGPVRLRLGAARAVTTDWFLL